jgi:hypothetical protein
MNTNLKWSFSSLNAFETCAYRYQQVRILKTVVDVMGEEARWGNTVHKHLEDRLKGKAQLPDFLKSLDPLVVKVEAAPGVKGFERKMAVNAQLSPVDYYAKDAWCRAIADVTVVNGKRALVLDWKTGKPRDSTDQLRLSTALVLANNPAVERVRISYIWLKDGNKTTQRDFTRADVPGIWADFLPRIKRVEIAQATNEWPMKPSGLCRKHCPVKHCPHYGG